MPKLYQCLLSFSSSTSSLALPKNDESTLAMVRPPTLIGLMVVGEEFLKLTVEIELDEWMRLCVSSLTPSLKS
jgi:hypothetical protein